MELKKFEKINWTTDLHGGLALVHECDQPATDRGDSEDRWALQSQNKDVGAVR